MVSLLPEEISKKKTNKCFLVKSLYLIIQRSYMDLKMLCF